MTHNTVAPRGVQVYCFCFSEADVCLGSSVFNCRELTLITYHNELQLPLIFFFVVQSPVGAKRSKKMVNSLRDEISSLMMSHRSIQLLFWDHFWSADFIMDESYYYSHYLLQKLQHLFCL